MKKIICLVVLVIVTLTVSCKKETTVISKEAPEVQLPKDDVNEVGVSKQSLTTTQLVAAAKTTTMKFENNEHDFGVIKQGSKVEYNFKFTNSGTNDLIITDAKGSCGCTIPEYPKEAVKPGASGIIKVSFNSEGKSGQQTKSVTLTANTPKGSELLTIKSTIVVDK